MNVLIYEVNKRMNKLTSDRPFVISGYLTTGEDKMVFFGTSRHKAFYGRSQQLASPSRYGFRVTDLEICVRGGEAPNLEKSILIVIRFIYSLTLIYRVALITVAYYHLKKFHYSEY